MDVKLIDLDPDGIPRAALINTVINGALEHGFRGQAKCQMSEAPAAEEMSDRVVCSREQFSFQMRLESGDGSGTFCNWRQSSRQLVPIQLRH